MSVRSTYRFARLPEWILFHPDLDAMDCRVYCVLDRYDGRDCFPAFATMSERLGVHDDTVRRAIRRLKAVGAIRVEKRMTVEKRQTSNRYVLAGDNPLRECTDAPPDPGTDAPPEGCTPAPLSRASNDPEQKEPLPSSLDTHAVAPNEGEGDSFDQRRTATANVYARIAVDKASNVGNEAAYKRQAVESALVNPDLDRYLTRWPDAPPDAVAAWLHGDKHSMSYFTDMEAAPEKDDGPVVAMPDALRRKKRQPPS